MPHHRIREENCEIAKNNKTMFIKYMHKNICIIFTLYFFPVFQTNNNNIYHNISRFNMLTYLGKLKIGISVLHNTEVTGELELIWKTR